MLSCFLEAHPVYITCYRRDVYGVMDGEVVKTEEFKNEGIFLV
jgi:hypothetical protein